ncbi:MAG: hypothetical protein ACRCUJ_07100 [Phocaeicola sp.]
MIANKQMSSSTGNIRALLIIITALVALWFSPIAKAEVLDTQGHWDVHDHYIKVGFVDQEGFTINVGIHSDASISILIANPDTMKHGSTLAHSYEGVVSVNGKRVNMTFELYDDGSTYILSKSKAGDNHIAYQLWNKSEVTFKGTGLNFWVSAKGVQKAWASMMKKSAI